MKPQSVCTKGHPVAFYYFMGPRGQHRKHAIKLLMEAINAPAKRFSGNEFLQDDAYGTFEDLLELAEEGKLKVPEHVKRIQNSPDIDMYEIRWNTIPVIDQNPVTGLYGDPYEVCVRLYMVEVGEQWTVGVHVHEKEVDGSEEHIRMSQGQEILQANRTAIEHRHMAWGVPELEGRNFDNWS